MKPRLPVFVVLATLLPATVCPAADLYEVTDAVRVAAPARFGTNFELKSFSPWSELHNNCWNKYAACEPVVFRHNGIATGGGADFLEDQSGKPVGDKPNPVSAGSGFWSTMGNGFWNGAEIRVYRVNGETIRLLRKDRVKQFDGLKDTEQKITLESAGEPVRRGDLYVLTMVRGDVPDALNPERPANHERQLMGSLPPTKGSGVRWEIDSTTFCPEGGSTASMKISIPAGANFPAGVEQPFLRFDGRELSFEPGKKYTCEIWLKQEGIAGPVTVQVGDRTTQKLDAGGGWKKHVFEVPNEAPIGPKTYPLLIAADSGGTLWVDNFVVREDGLAAFAIFPKWVEILRDFRPGVIRSMSGRFLKTFDGWLSEGFTRKLVWDVNQGPQWLVDFGLREHLELCKQTGARPWLMTYVLPDDEELDALAEYLGAPADVGYGRVRAAHGQAEPWTEVFDAIYVECANEMWNDKFFAPQAFGAQPELAGKVANRVISRLKNSPYNTKKNIKGIAPAWAHNLYNNGKGWTHLAVMACPSADVIGSAPSGYIGGYDGESIVGADDADLFHANLFYSAQVFEPKLAEIDRIRGEMQARTGNWAEILKYEAGPGYAIPNPNKPFIEEAEQVGKSLALATATLDNFLFVIANNGNSNYFQTRVGPNWSSHNSQFQPQTTWLALLLRNKFCEGSLMEVREKEVAKVDLPERRSVGLGNDGKPSNKTIQGVPAVPVTRLYAFKDGRRHSFLALNRSFTEPRTIRIDLPYPPSPEVRKVWLTVDDPRATNRDGEMVSLREETARDFKSGYEVTIPPASAVVLINNEK